MEKFLLNGLKNYEIPIGEDFILDPRGKNWLWIFWRRL